MTPYRDGAVPRRLITRSAAQRARLIATVVLLALAAAVFALAAVLGWIQDAFIAWLAAGLSACGAIGMLFGSLRAGTGDAACPVCGAPLRDLERVGKHEGIHCAKCDAFLEAEDGVVRPTAPDTIADEPIFSTDLCTHFQFPPGCVVCGGDVTQELPLQVQTTSGIQTTSLRITVPHCRMHDDGAALAGGGDSGFVILFRSYPYRRAFRELNEGRAIEHPPIFGRAKG